MVLLTLIPALLSIIYAVTLKMRSHQRHNVTLMLLGGFIAMFNVGAMYGFYNDMYLSWSLRCLQQVLSCMIVPIAYMYFSAQMGTKRFNSVAISLWSMMALLVVPTTLFTLDGVMPQVATHGLVPMTLHFFSQGREVLFLHMADVVIMLQALLTLARLISIMVTIRRYHLTVPKYINYFLGWWGAAIAFIVFTSLHTTEEMSDGLMQWAYFVLYSILVASIYYLLSMDMDLRLRMLNVSENEDEDEELRDTSDAFMLEQSSKLRNEGDSYKDGHESETEVVGDIDTFVVHCHMMAEQVRVMMQNRKFLDPTLCIDSMAQQLCTNRTYFCRMMKAEFNCTFGELLANHRVEYAKRLLMESDAPMMDIALQSGFTTEKSLTRRFTQIYGVTPHKWREQHCTH